MIKDLEVGWDYYPTGKERKMIQAINQKLNIQRQKKRLSFDAPFFSAPDTMLPEGERNYTIFNQNKVSFIASQKENAIPYLKDVLTKSDNEEEIVESLYIVDKLVDNGTKGIPAMYPVLAKHNDTKSPNIQVMLAGIYRKTQVPDAFGPLVSMLIEGKGKRETEKELEQSGQKTPFDPNEEIGGAILSYIENYSHNPKKIDYSA